MTATQLWFLGVLGSELVTDAVEQLDVALLRVLLHGGDEGPGHGAGGLGGDGCVGPVVFVVSLGLTDWIGEGERRREHGGR
jgi:hypothetical protein